MDATWLISSQTDSIIMVQSEEFNGDSLIEVLWAEKKVMMFTEDIRTSERVERKSSPQCRELEMFKALLEHTGSAHIPPHRVWAFLNSSVHLDVSEYNHLYICETCQKFAEVCLGSETFGGALQNWLKGIPREEESLRKSAVEDCLLNTSPVPFETTRLAPSVSSCIGLPQAGKDVMPITKYRITDPTLAMYLEDGHHVSETVPRGATISTDGKKFNGEKLIEIIWNSKSMMMFTQDVKKHGQLID